MSELTVVIATFNRQPMLNELVCALSQQSVVPEVIVADDGTREHLFGHEHPIIARYLWSRRDGYHRVARYNEAVSFVRTPYVLLLDDDALPVFPNCLAAHLALLEAGADAVRGLFWHEAEAKQTPWFSSVNLSLRTSLAQALGPFDWGFDGNYAFEDLDLGRELERVYRVVMGDRETAVDHRGEIHHEYHTGIEANRAYFSKKWNVQA